MMERSLEAFLEESSWQMTEDIAGLVEIPSVADCSSPKENMPFGKACRQVLDRMLSYAARDGLTSFDHQGYCGSILAGDGDVEIGIWNHLDIVPAGDGWLYPPFSLTKKGEYLIGRGVQDNKGPAIAVYYALRFCKEQGLLRHIRVRHIFGCQEESGMGDVKYYVARFGAPDFSFVSDCPFPVCCGEKGICRVRLESVCALEGFIVLAGGSVCNSVPDRAMAELVLAGKKIQVEAEGRGGHAAFPDNTVNAIGILVGKLEECLGLGSMGSEESPEGCLEMSGLAEGAGFGNKERKILRFLKAAASDGYGEGLGIACKDDLSGSLTCNAGVLSLEQGKARLELDIRYPVTISSSAFLAELKKRAKEAGFAVVKVHDEPPHYIEKNSPFVSLLMEAWQEETGLWGEPYVMGGGTYARHIPGAVGFGTGMGQELAPLGLPVGHGNCHSADEVQSLENLKKAIHIYVNALTKVDKWVAEGGAEKLKNGGIENEEIEDQ